MHFIHDLCAEKLVFGEKLLWLFGVLRMFKWSLINNKEEETISIHHDSYENQVEFSSGENTNIWTFVFVLNAINRISKRIFNSIKIIQLIIKVNGGNETC